MIDGVKRQIEAIERMTVGQLRVRYAEVSGEAARSGDRQWLFRRIAWRVQAMAEGDLTQRARDRALELARDADLRVKPPREMDVSPPPRELRTVSGRLSLPRDEGIPPSGATLKRVFRGHEYRVTVLPNGFEYDGRWSQNASVHSRYAREHLGSHAAMLLSCLALRVPRSIGGALISRMRPTPVTEADTSSTRTRVRPRRDRRQSSRVGSSGTGP